MTLRSIRRTTVLLAGLCLALMAGVVFEWLKPPQLSPVSVEAAQPGQPSIPREPPPANVSLPPLSKYEEIVSRPLFLADRRPASETPEPSTEPAAQQETTMWLVGVILSPEGKRALVYLKEENRLVRLQVGESAGGWKLESLAAASATLRRDEDTLELKLERNRKDGPPPSPQATPQRTARQAPAAAQPPQQASAQKGAQRAPAAAPQQPQQAGRQAPTSPAAPGRPGPAAGARQLAPQAPTAGRTAAAPARPAAPPSVRSTAPPPAAAQPAAPSPRLQQQLDAITSDEDTVYPPNLLRQRPSSQ